MRRTPRPEPENASGVTGPADVSGAARGLRALAPGVWVPPQAVSETAVRSSGPGGQNVNKVSTKIVLVVDREALLEALPPDARDRLAVVAGSRWSAAGLVVASSESRSQRANREAARLRVRQLLVEALHRPAKRIRRRPSLRANARRVEQKRLHGARKRERRGGSDGG